MDTSDERSRSTLPEATDIRRVRRARLIRRGALGVVAAFVLSGLAGVFGARTGTAAATAGGYELTVRFPSVTRPALAILWSVEIEHPGGFDGTITVATTADYFSLFDFNGIDPQPSKSFSDGDRIIWEFEAPPGDAFEASMDARVEPGVQSGRAATTSVLVGGSPVVSVSYTTRVMP